MSAVEFAVIKKRKNKKEILKKRVKKTKRWNQCVLKAMSNYFL